MTARLLRLKATFGGKISGRTLATDTPGHRPGNLGTAITDSPGSPNGLLVHVFNGSGPSEDLAAKARMLDALGETPERRQWNQPIDHGAIARRVEADREAAIARKADLVKRRRRALDIWDEARDPRGSLADFYLTSRSLKIGSDIAVTVLRYHPKCRWEHGFAPAMIAAMRDIATDQLVGVHRTALTGQGVKIGRKMLGTAAGSAIKFDGDSEITMGLAIGEGVESVLAARQLGIRPAWALGSVGGIAAFPVIRGVSALTILAENDSASERACEAVAARWHAAGAEVIFAHPATGNDLNDALREAHIR